MRSLEELAFGILEGLSVPARVALALVCAVGLALVGLYSSATFRPPSPEDFIEVSGTVAGYGHSPSDEPELHISLAEKSKVFSIAPFSSDLRAAIASIEREVPSGAPLTLTVTRRELANEGKFASVYAARGPEAVYFKVEQGLEGDLENQRWAKRVTVGACVCGVLIVWAALFQPRLLGLRRRRPALPVSGPA